MLLHGLSIYYRYINIDSWLPQAIHLFIGSCSYLDAPFFTANIVWVWTELWWGMEALMRSACVVWCVLSTTPFTTDTKTQPENLRAVNNSPVVKVEISHINSLKFTWSHYILRVNDLMYVVMDLQNIIYAYIIHITWDTYVAQHCHPCTVCLIRILYVRTVLYSIHTVSYSKSMHSYLCISLI